MIRLWSRRAPLAGAAPLEQPREPCLVEVGGERVGAEARHAGDLLRVPDHMHGESLLGARLGEVEALAVRQGDAQRQRALARSGRAVGQRVPPLQPARAGQVRHEVQAVGLDVEELAQPAAPR